MRQRMWTIELAACLVLALLLLPGAVPAEPEGAKAGPGAATAAAPGKAEAAKSEPAKPEAGQAAAGEAEEKTQPGSEEHLVPGQQGGLPSGTAGQRAVVREARQGLGSLVEILVTTDKQAEARKAIAEAFLEMGRIEALTSDKLDTSEVHRINQNAGNGTPVPISAEMLKILATAKEVSELSSGAFDVSWAALRGLWSFEGPDPTVPHDEEIAARTKLIDYTKLELVKEPPTARLLLAGSAIGLGGIAKGYAMDRAAQILRSRGFTDFIVYAGGDLYTAGQKAAGKPWTIGVQHPRVRGALAAVFPSPGGAVVTSGDYEAYFVKDGVRYHHIIDPKTGKPAAKTMAVTLFSPDAVLADALCTGVFVLGPEQGLALAEKIPGVEVLIFDTAGKPYLSAGLQGKVKVEPLVLP